MEAATCLVLLLCVLGAAAQAEVAWWQSGIIYQIYPKSFKDSDGDGTGDIQGVIEKLDYLSDLGIAAIWLSPIFKSPMADNGYDIADFTDIDPLFGNMEDFDALLTEAHERNIRVVLDFVPNHSSDEHEWFIASSDPNHVNHTIYRDFYVWVDGQETVPPNNWVNMFDQGSAWKYNDARGQFYLHQFHEKQPDLNYTNEEVIDAMQDQMRFWLEKGVDGFRMDAVMCLVEKDGFPDQVEGEPSPMQHQPKTYEVIQRFREVVDEFDQRVMMTEAYGTVDQVLGYYGNETNPGAHFSFNFLLITALNNESTAEDFANITSEWITAVEERGVWSNWVIGNHDQHRVASRYSPELVDGMNMLVTLLPGTAVTYNGEEIGMEDNYNMTCEVAHDPQGCLDGVTLGNSRDPQRTPFQWDNSTSAGFSTNETTWLPVNDNYEWLNTAQQEEDERSHLKTYRKLAALRMQQEVLAGETYVNTSGGVLAVSRTLDLMTIVLVNIGLDDEVVLLADTLPFIDETIMMEVYATSLESEVQEGSSLNSSTEILLRPHDAVVIRKTTNAASLSSISVFSTLLAPVVALIWATTFH